MAKTYSWHPGSGRVASIWAVPVPIFPDEIISSWLVRAALTQGCDPLVLTGELWPKWRAWTVDVDRLIPDEHLKALCAVSDISADIFHSAMLYPIVQQIYLGNPPVKAVWPWILSLGKRNTKIRSGLQYCPICLSEDNSPYYRIQWRFAWHTGCETHQCKLHDSCWRCGAPIEPHRLVAEDKIVSICASCKADLKQANTTPWNEEAKSFQLETDRILQGKSGCYLGKAINSHHWFELASFFESFIRRVNRKGEEKLLGFINEIGIVLPDSIPIIAGAGIEWLNVQMRERLLGAVWIFLTVDKDRFLHVLKTADISRQGLCTRKESVPSLLSGIIDGLPDHSVTRTKSQKPHLSGPRPRHEVIRMMKRLERKLALLKNE